MDRRGVSVLLGPVGRRRLSGVAGMVVVAGLLEALAVTAVYPFLLAATRPEVMPDSALLSKAYELSGAGTTREFLLLLGAGVLAIVVLTNLVGALSAWQQQKAIRAFEHDLTVRLLRRFLSRPYAYFLRKNSVELHRMLIQDCRSVTTGLVEPGLEILSRSVAAVAIFTVLIVIEPVIAVSALGLFGVIAGSIFWVGRRRRTWLGRRMHAARQLAARTSSEALIAIKPLKSAGREREFLDRFVASDGEAARLYAEENMMARLPRYLIEGLTMVSVVSVFLFIIASGGDLITYLPAIGMFTFAGFRLLPAIHGILLSIGSLRFNEVVLKGIAEELHEEEEASLELASPMGLKEEIKLDRVGFSYEGSGRQALDAVDITIPRGTSVGIVGRTGSGKSTIMDLVLGLLQPTTGRVLVDGHPIDASNARTWRASVSYVPQQVVLLDDTLARNVAFGIPDDEIDMERVRRACDAADILSFIEKELPEGFQTVVGERGVRLSGGQRQRIGIARALYDDREVIVFDEATSEVDPLTERAINDAIDSMAHKKTVLVVAHRFSAIRNCDRIYVLDGGRVVASGTYDSLVATDDRFRQMAER